MKIQNVLFAEGAGGFFFDDQAAIRSGLEHNGFIYQGAPFTSAFDRVRIPAESISVMLVLENGETALGDCCAVQYSGAAGRDPLFIAARYIPLMTTHLTPELLGRECSDFKENAEFLDTLKSWEGKQLPTAIRYGISQALLNAAAKSANLTMAEVISEEYNLPLELKPVKIYIQSGDDRYINVDKMILKGADCFPHGLINEPYKKMGPRGENFKEYAVWVRNRIFELRKDESYNPELHFDVYGTLGIVFENNLPEIVDYLAKLETEVAPFQLRIEAPVDAGSRQGQIEALKEICELISKKGLTVEIVADEWCNTLEDIALFAAEKACHMVQIKTPDLGGIDNTIEAVLLCKEKGVKAFLGGSCAETDISARTCTQVAIATQPYQILAKPGMGVDEGYMIVRNEMERTLALLKARA
ncbi:methylaspartate ammonia-lyase [bacterium]|nr:methylaspartate ammonia-lyase [bacterium]